jgi:predicted XRE-type DNA-binding protein
MQERQAPIIRADFVSSTAPGLLGIPQPRLSKVLREQFPRRFFERNLMDCLTRLGQDINIVVRTTPEAKRRGAVWVSFA